MYIASNIVRNWYWKFKGKRPIYIYIWEFAWTLIFSSIFLLKRFYTLTEENCMQIDFHLYRVVFLFVKKYNKNIFLHTHSNTILNVLIWMSILLSTLIYLKNSIKKNEIIHIYYIHTHTFNLSILTTTK